jgi:uncharacterized membrane protein YfbV (UPF0208 family)
LSPSSDQNLVHLPGNVIDMMTSGFSKLTQWQQEQLLIHLFQKWLVKVQKDNLICHAARCFGVTMKQTYNALSTFLHSSSNKHSQWYSYLWGLRKCLSKVFFEDTCSCNWHFQKRTLFSDYFVPKISACTINFGIKIWSANEARVLFIALSDFFTNLITLIQISSLSMQQMEHSCELWNSIYVSLIPSSDPTFCTLLKMLTINDD